MQGTEFEIKNSVNSFSLETDEFGNIESWSIKNMPSNISASFKKKKKRKDKDRENFLTTGIPQIGTTYPVPLDREDLIDFEYKVDQWYCRSWVSIVSFLIAVFVDGFCFFESIGHAFSDPVIKIVAIIGAVLAVDALPIFFAYNLRKTQIKEKSMHIILCILSLFVFIIVLGILAYTCIGYDEGGMLSLMVLFIIPIATSSFCFTAAYITYDPLKNELIKYSKLRMHRMENINQLKALIQEIEVDPDYETKMTEIENERYDSAKKRIKQLSDMYKAIVRIKLAEFLKIPADTSDLSQKF
ncbi:MAG: hypothetical protein IJW86_09875 [Clostridia bacterium]|nr:hypothetical protein [Clostridia bacterium]